MAWKLARSAKADVWIAAQPEDIWSVVTDVTRGGEWSGESQGCMWVRGSTGPTPGARFRGRNKRRAFRWSRVSEVVRIEAPHEFVWRTLPSFQYRDSTEWRITLEREHGGTRVTEEYTLDFMNPLVEALIYVLIPAHHDRTADLAADLQRLKTLVESTRHEATPA